MPDIQGAYSPFGEEKGKLSNFFQAPGVRAQWQNTTAVGEELTVSHDSLPDRGSTNLNIELQNLPKGFHIFYYVVFDNHYAIGLFNEYENHKYKILLSDKATATIPVKPEWSRMGNEFDIFVWFREGGEWRSQKKIVSFYKSDCDPLDPVRCFDDKTVLHCSKEHKERKIFCPVGTLCHDGKCMDSCEDTDQGNTPGVKGTVSGFAKTGMLGEVTDTCVRLDTDEAVLECDLNCGVLEHYCKDQFRFETEPIACEHGCRNGACIQKTACSDTDGGTNYYALGIVKDETGREFTDACNMEGGYLHTITEYYCNPQGIIESELFECFYGCKQDMSGKDIGVCNGDGTMHTCTDSDRGLNYYERGQVNAGPFMKQDSCWGGVNPKGVHEWYCFKDMFKVKSVECEFGCKEGQCIKEAPKCIDSDGGKNLFVKGETRYRNTEVARSDSCKSEEILEEVSCDGDSMQWEAIKCDYGCKFGACQAAAGGFDLKLNNVKLSQPDDSTHPAVDGWIAVEYCIQSYAYDEQTVKTDIVLGDKSQRSTLTVKPRDETCRTDYIVGETGKKNRVHVKIDVTNEFGEPAEENNDMYQELVI